eukprot:scaffold13655_cov114-Isochrysis_galbana.AAC.5
MCRRSGGGVGTHWGPIGGTAHGRDSSPTPHSTPRSPSRFSIFSNSSPHSILPTPRPPLSRQSNDPPHPCIIPDRPFPVFHHLAPHWYSTDRCAHTLHAAPPHPVHPPPSGDFGGLRRLPLPVRPASHRDAAGLRHGGDVHLYHLR